jgi:hypothetical protein
MLQWAIHVCFSVCSKCFICFQTYVASVSFGCCKTRSGCCIYMQVFQVFLYVHCKCFILMFAYDCNGYTRVFKFFFVFCKCFRRLLPVFQLFRMYVASVSSGCCKSRSGVARVAMRVRRGEGASGPCMQSGGADVVRVACGPRVGARNVGSGRDVLAQA